MTIGDTILGVIVGAFTRIGAYFPQFLGGLVVLIIGLVIAALLREVVVRALRILGVERWFDSAGQMLRRVQVGGADGASVWTNLLAELVRWTVVVLFLIPAVDAWGLPRITDVLNQVLLYVPNVFVAVVVGFVGLVIANLVFDLVQNVARNLGSSSAVLLANVARYSLLFFTALVVLNQLGVAADLIRILFTGIVAMIALAGGIAFGVGGQDAARGVVADLQRRFEEMPTQPVAQTTEQAVVTSRRPARKATRRRARR